jgi:hypothetical protein
MCKVPPILSLVKITREELRDIALRASPYECIVLVHQKHIDRLRIMVALRLLGWNTEVGIFTAFGKKVAPRRGVVPVAIRVLASKGVFLLRCSTVSEYDGGFRVMKKWVFRVYSG